MSLKSRLSIGLAFGLLGVFALQWLMVTLAIRQAAESYMLTRLQHDMDAVLAGLTVDRGGKMHLDTGKLGPIYKQPFSGHYYRIRAADRVWRSRALWDRDLPDVEPAGAAADERHAIGPQGQPLIILTRRFTVHGRKIVLSLAENLAPLEIQLKRFNRQYAAVSLIALVLLLMVQAVSVHLGLKPLARLRQDLARLERGEISELDETAPREIRPLVRELNRLLTVMHERLQRSRRALGNLAHAFKTPLTLLGDLAASEKVRAEPDIHRPLMNQSAAMTRLIERELKRARLAGHSIASQHFDLKKELTDLGETLKAIYRDRPLHIDLRLSGNPVLLADREDMLELLGNLLDNACKWARSRVNLTVETEAGFKFYVEDDGPGCAPEELNRLTRRGTRLDEAAPGHGLGLAIVRDIVTAYHGNLEFARSEELGGLRVRVTLPIKPVAQT